MGEEYGKKQGISGHGQGKFGWVGTVLAVLGWSREFFPTAPRRHVSSLLSSRGRYSGLIQACRLERMLTRGRSGMVTSFNSAAFVAALARPSCTGHQDPEWSQQLERTEKPMVRVGFSFCDGG